MKLYRYIPAQDLGFRVKVIGLHCSLCVRETQAHDSFHCKNELFEGFVKVVVLGSAGPRMTMRSYHRGHWCLRLGRRMLCPSLSRDNSWFSL